MTSTELIRSGSDALKAETIYPAFSFFFRIHSGSEKQLHDLGHIRNRVHEVLKKSDLTSTALERIKSEADRLMDQVNFESGALSIGLFVSLDQAILSQYFINLPERDYLGGYFSGYETAYAAQQSAPYLLVTLEPSTLRIYRGRGEHLETLPESDATRHLQSVYRRRVSPQPDKDGKVRRGHHDSDWKKEFLEAVASVVSKEQVPIFLTGLALADLTETEFTSHGIKVLATLDDVCQFSGSDALKTLVHDLSKNYTTKKFRMLVDRCKVSQGSHKLASGADEILRCAKEGRGEILLLPYPCWEASGTQTLGTLHEAIRAMAFTDGAIEFLPGELIKEWDEAAMILRY